ncbi:DinB family protein [Roseobacter sinensis]|uniref:Damage-inducible protein DinB n=1 Tax=Roseobacter sinensis TaxID=2931391 RepID=A0ABT3BEJ8_9RHOB|nr:DinB family protein [Roseobacter sp. WL0113]MCV3271999.1 damage-inducible protein DinB [Roseobacter sp. WL0113]
MIDREYVRLMARYNAWQNHSLYYAAAGLDAEAREADRGAFWGSIRKTLAHLAWGDQIWIARFDGGDGPAMGAMEAFEAYDWETLWSLRPELDARIAGWAWSVADDDLKGDLTWHSGFLGADLTRPKALCVVQLFNHETHHRGQVHAMLTAAGARPDDTDVPFMPDEVPEWR